MTEDAAEGYTTAVNGADGSKAEGAVTEDGATVAFTNTYGTATEGRDISTAGLFTKTLEGRDWAEGDSFQFARGVCRRLQDRQRDGRRRHQGGR